MADLESDTISKNRSNNPYYYFILIIGAGLLIRFFYFEQYPIGFSDDSIQYFWYANDIKILNQLPNYLLSQSGWPIFLSFFFEVFHFDNFWEYIQLQRILSMILSIITIMPIYYLCNRFFNRNLSLIGAFLFGFEPRIIQNSLFGITESLYILILTIIFVLFLNNNKKIIFLSFGLLGISTIIRVESLVLIIPLSIIFLIRFKNELNYKRNFLIMAVFFLIMLIPVMTLTPLITFNPTDNEGNPVSNRLVAELKYVSGNLVKDEHEVPWYYNYNFQNIIKFLGWSMIPIFLLFVPIGMVLIFKQWQKNNLFIILVTICTLIPGFYALLRFADGRYIFPAYPMFCLIALFAIRYFDKKIFSKKILYLLIIVFVVISSTVFLETKLRVDTVYEGESFEIAKEVVKQTKVINQYSPESKYVIIAKMHETEFPILSSEFKNIPLLDYDANSFEEYLMKGEEMGLTHLVLDRNESIYRHEFFKDVFENGENIPYLIKKFDSSELNFKYHVKIFEIDYEKFHELVKLE